MAHAPRRGARGGSDPHVQLLLLVAAGLALRLLLSPIGGDRFDTGVMRAWAQRMTTLPLAEFYAASGDLVVDHLPGDLWFLWALARVHGALWEGSAAAGFPSTSFLLLLKLVPALADAGIAVLLYALVQTSMPLAAQRRGTGLVAAAAWLFNPCPIFLASIWGQWDSVSTCCALLALLLLLRGRFAWALPVLAYAALIKPPFALLAPIFVLWWAPPRLSGRGAALGALREGACAAAASAAVLVLAPLPFGIGFPPFFGRTSLLERASYAATRYDGATINAWNLWQLLFGARPDDAPFLIGLSVARWGLVLLVLAYALVLALFAVRAARRRGVVPTLVWACLAVTYVGWMLPTRVHERYLFPAIALACLAAALQPRVWPLYAAISTGYLANLTMVYWVNTGNRPPEQLYGALAICFSVANVVLLRLVLFLPARYWERSGAEPGDRREPAHEPSSSGGETRPYPA